MNQGARDANEQMWRHSVLEELRAIRKLLELLIAANEETD